MHLVTSNSRARGGGAPWAGLVGVWLGGLSESVNWCIDEWIGGIYGLKELSPL